MQALLHKDDLVSFQETLEIAGWTTDTSKQHEALRMCKPGCVPVILYTRGGSDLLSYNHANTGRLVVEFKERKA